MSKINMQEPMPDSTFSSNTAPDKPTAVSRSVKRSSSHAGWIVGIILTYIVGLASGYGLRGVQKPADAVAEANPTPTSSLLQEMYPDEGYTLPVTLGNLGPQMVEVGVIDRAAFIAIYDQAGLPLSSEHLTMLDGKYSDQIVMNQENSYFLLNLFWALGLVNKNEILDSGPIQKNANGTIEGFASTGGWTLTNKPIREIYSSQKLLNLTAEQQALVEEASQLIYRPCCNNPTHFPDCNHGMAMLGLLELMASQDVSLDEMLLAAKYVNAYWYPQQTLEQAAYFQMVEGKSFTEIDARALVGQQYSSGAGFTALHQFLEANGWLPKSNDIGGTCGV